MTLNLYAKLWVEILGDPKLMRAARKGAKQLVVTPWLFAFAKKADDGGRLTVGGLPAEPEDIAQQIPGVTARQVAQCLEELKSIGVLTADDDGALRLTKWELRSGSTKPSDTPERVRERVQRHRDKKRALNDTSDDTGVTEPGGNASDETPGNAPVTPYALARGESEERTGEPETEPELPHTHTPGGRGSAASDPNLAKLEVALAERLGEHWPSALAFLDTRPQQARAAWVGRIGAAMDNPPHYTAHEVGQAAADLATAVHEGRDASPRAFRVFCQKYREDTSKAAAPKAIAGNGGRSLDRLGAEDAGAILSTIRSLAKKHEGPNGTTRYIRKQDVQALGADVYTAYDRIGGADRVLGTTGEYYGALKADFARELAVARGKSEPAHA